MSRHPSIHRLSVVAVVLVVTTVLTACAVGPDEVRPVEGLQTARAESSSMPTADSPVLYLARGDELVRSRRPLSSTAGVAEVLAALATPVTQGEARRDLRTVVGSGDPENPLFLSTDDAPSATPVSGQARVVATAALLALPPAQQLLAIAQVTLSLSSLGAESVEFVDPDGTALAVPAPGGRTLDRPVTAADYDSLRAK